MIHIKNRKAALSPPTMIYHLPLMNIPQQQQQLLVLTIMIALTGKVAVLRRKFVSTRYSALIPYLNRAWSLALWGDIECREYLRFTEAEIQQLITHFHMGPPDQPLHVEGLKYIYSNFRQKALCLMLY